MKQPLRVVQYGAGPIGLSCIATLLEKQRGGHVALVGVVDIDPDKVGRDAGELCGAEAVGVRVHDDAEAVLSETRPDVVLHTTASFVDRVEEQLADCLRAGAHVVSSTEELSFPFVRHPEAAERLDALARRHGRVLLGTGVNPGYAMDALALMATGPCTDVRRVRVTRIVDAGRRRGPLQAKVGAGLTPEAFAERKAAGGFGHIGLVESLQMVAAGLGVDLDRIDERLEPVLAGAAVETPHRSVAAGHVAGIHHHAAGYVGDAAVVTLDLHMYVGAADTRDEVIVEGDPPIELVVRGGIFGDTATTAALVNAIPAVMGAEPGLRTVADLPVPRVFAPSLAHRVTPLDAR